MFAQIRARELDPTGRLGQAARGDPSTSGRRADPSFGSRVAPQHAGRVVARSVPRVVGGGRLAQQLHRHLQRASTGAQVDHRRRVLPRRQDPRVDARRPHRQADRLRHGPMPGDAGGTQANALGRPVPPDEPQRAGVRLVGPRGAAVEREDVRVRASVRFRQAHREPGVSSGGGHPGGGVGA